MSRTPIVVALVSLLAAVPMSLIAQRQLPGFTEVIDVRVVNVEVVVTDRQGNRVPGLSVDDFELLVDGERTTIDFFSEIRDGRATAGADDEAATVPALGDDPSLRVNYLVFVDDYFSVAQDRDRVLDRLREDLAGMGPDDRAAVVAFDGKEMSLLSSWTTDRAELADALNRAQRRETFGLQRLAELRQNDIDRAQRADMQLLQIERIQAAGGEAPDQPFFETKLDPVERAYANRLTQQLRSSVLAAASAMRSFATPPGRKVMLLLAGGWPYSPAEYTVSTFGSNVEEIVGATLDESEAARDEMFRPLVDTANLLGYTLYPVDVPGQNREIGGDASEGRGDFERYAPDAGAGGTGQPRELQTHRSLFQLADATGGRALINSERDDALSDVIADTRTFYWLGFSVEREEDDREHEIEVRVNRPGLQVRSRQGFVDLSRSKEVGMMVESSLLFGDPPSTRPLLLRFSPPQRAGLGKMSVPLEVGIPMDEITLLPSNGHYQNELEIQIRVMDPNGTQSDTSVDTVLIDGERPPAPGALFYYETDLRLRRRPHRIVVAVYDPLSGAILSSSAEVNP